MRDQVRDTDTGIVTDRIKSNVWHRFETGGLGSAVWNRSSTGRTTGYKPVPHDLGKTSKAAMTERTGAMVKRSAAMQVCALACAIALTPPAWGGGVDLIVSQSGSTTSLSIGTNPPFHSTDNTVQNARAIEVPNSTVVANVWDEVTSTGETLHYYALSPDGESIVRVRKTTFDLKLRHGHFDPIEDGANPVEPSLTAGANNNLYIVQFVTQSLEVYRDALDALGVKVYNYIPRHSYIVKMTPAVKTLVQALEFVRAVVPFHPAYKVSDDLRAELAAEYSSSATQKYTVMVHKPGLSQQQAVGTQISALGGTVLLTSPGGYALKALLSLDQIRAILALDEVQFINRSGETSPAMDVVRKISGANYLKALQPPDVPFTGSGVRGAVLEHIKLDRDHPAFDHPNSDFPVTRCSPLGGRPHHGPRVYGTVFAKGIPEYSSGQVKGILPDGEGIYYTKAYFDPQAEDPLDPSCRFRRQITSHLIGAACCPPDDDYCPFGGVFQTNSWGSSEPGCVTNDYSDVTEEIDDIAFKYDILICQAQGNCGEHPGEGICDYAPDPRIGYPEAWAKNVLTVGGITHYNVVPFSAHRWCAPGQATCPGRGPAEDGRVKPDLVHVYDNVITTCQNNEWCYTDACNGTDTCSTNLGCETCGPIGAPFGGTSAATPITCGHGGLIYEMWASEPDFQGRNMFGNVLPDPNCDPQTENCVFINRPHAATVKALMINTAHRYDLVDEDANGEFLRDNQGWGIVDVKRLYDERDKIYVIDQTIIVDNLATPFANFEVTVGTGEPELRVTLVYADPPGSPITDINAVNDLSLLVTSPSGVDYWGNCGLHDGNFSVPESECEGPNPPHPCDGSQNPVIDTVENVFIENPEAGRWEVRIDADDIAKDGHVIYTNNDPSECCDDPENCGTTFPRNADFALVVNGIDAVYGACCNGLNGSCVDKTRSACSRSWEEWYPYRTCATVGFCPSTE